MTVSILREIRNRTEQERAPRTGHFQCQWCFAWVPEETDQREMCGDCLRLAHNIIAANNAMRELLLGLDADGDQFIGGAAIKVTFGPGGIFDSVEVIR